MDMYFRDIFYCCVRNVFLVGILTTVFRCTYVDKRQTLKHARKGRRNIRVRKLRSFLDSRLAGPFDRQHRPSCFCSVALQTLGVITVVHSHSNSGGMYVSHSGTETDCSLSASIYPCQLSFHPCSVFVHLSFGGWTMSMLEAAVRQRRGLTRQRE